MIRIRHSTEPYQELDIEGSNSEFAELRSAILNFCDGTETTIVLPAQSEFDPSPYQCRLEYLCLRKTDDPILVSVADEKLFIAGEARFLRLFARNLPYDAHHTSSVNYHVHFDRLGREDHMSEASLGLVLTLKR